VKIEVVTPKVLRSSSWLA